MVGREYERRGITKDGAKMLMVQANVTVPKLSVLVPRLAGRRQLRDGGPHVGPAAAVRVAELALLDHGRPSRRSNTLTQVRVAELRRDGKDPTPEEIARIREDVDRLLRADLPLLLPHLRPARRRADRPGRHAQHARHVAVRVLNAPIVRAPGGVLRI